MLNEALVSKYFQNAWKGYILIGASKTTGRVLISSNTTIIQAPAQILKLKPFSDRELIPEFPEAVGHSYLYGKIRGFQKTGPRLNEYLEDQLKGALQELTVSRWSYDGLRLLHTQTRHRFLQQALLDLFTPGYKVFNSPEHANVVLARDRPASAEDILAVISTVVIENPELLPNVPHLISTEG